MKKLSYFLWVCVVALLVYMAYFLSTTTRWREEDLLAIQQQNNVLQTFVSTQEQLLKKLTFETELLIPKLGNSPKDVAIFAKATQVQQFGANYNAKLHLAFAKEDMQAIAVNRKVYSLLISKLDTSLQDFEKDVVYEPQNLEYDIFRENYLYSTKNKLVRTINKASESFFNRIGGYVIICGGIRAFGFSRTIINNEGEDYNGYLVLLTSSLQVRPTIKIDGVKKYINDLENITIPYQPVRFDANGLSRQKIAIEIATINPYTIEEMIYHLNCTYTIKRKK